MDGEQRHGRRRNDAAAVRAAALGHNAGGQRALEHGTRKTRVAADADVRTKELGRRTAKAKREVARKIGVGDTTDAIGTEDVLGHRIAPSQVGKTKPPTLVEKKSGTHRAVGRPRLYIVSRKEIKP